MGNTQTQTTVSESINESRRLSQCGVGVAGFCQPAGSLCRWVDAKASPAIWPRPAVALSQLAHLGGLRSHLSSNVHMAHLGLAGSSPLVHLSRTHRRRDVRRPKLLTSVDDGAAVVEDDPALVQGGDGVEEVEGPQIPLKSPAKGRFTLSLALPLFVSAKSAVNLITW